MNQLVIRAPGGFQDFAPQVSRVRPLAPARRKKPTRVSPVTYLKALPDGDRAPGLRPPKFYYDPMSLHDPKWRLRAVCAGKGKTPEGIKLWFPGPGGSQRGKLYCAVCPVRRECKKWADDNEIEWGIWGGEIRHRDTKTSQSKVPKDNEKAA